jgi:signal transduction histidine kinase
MAGWTWFVAALYPSKFIKWLAWGITLIMIPAVAITVSTPVTFFSYLMYILDPAIIVLLIYMLYFSFRGMIKKNLIDMVYFIAFTLFSYSVIHDLRVSLGLSESSYGYTLSFTVVVFILIQAALLLYKWVKAFHEKEKMQNDLEFMNRNLELMVNERTQELIKRNEEIEKQSYHITQQNKQLSETILLKNKIFSVIAHDLRSPVVNILYMLNLLKEEEYKAKYETFANSCINYSQMVINLLENMLVWGKGQEDKIKFSPGKHNLADVILTNLSIMKETADRKDIKVNFTQAGNPYAFFDKDLIDIVIRNLMSNAVKYTRRGGRISILMKSNSNNGKGAMIKICDNGVGISAERQQNLFSLTEIDSTPGTDNEQGTGLGLKLCQELVNINNGNISVSGKEGEGTCFTIILPPDRL